ncbi:hypothetical protein R1flu_007078 [Riccia fluitans]|uniref:Uncharacterized protein n=1 Tax=Riccia fluitans TaxID=41844 RepID=A0ABD1YXV4_9MARC
MARLLNCAAGVQRNLTKLPTSKFKRGSARAIIRKLNMRVLEFYRPADAVPDLDIVVFHGFEADSDGEDGAFQSSWMGTGEYGIWLETWLRESFPRSRIFSVSYPSVTESQFSGINESAAKSLTEYAGIGQMCSVVLVGAGMGAQALLRFVKNAEWHRRVFPLTFFKAVKGMFFFSHDDSSIFQSLRISAWSFNQLRMDFGWRINGVIIADHDRRAFGEKKAQEPHDCGNINELGQAEAVSKFGVDRLWILAGATCKPKDQSSSSFRLLVAFVQGIADMDRKKILHQATEVAIWRRTLGFALPHVTLQDPVEDVLRSTFHNRRVALVGKNGVERSTLAREVFLTICVQFSLLCFVHNVKYRSRGMHLYELIGNNLYSGNGTKVYISDCSRESLKGAFHQRNVLLILDDITQEHIDLLTLHPDLLSKDSRMIITCSPSAMLMKFRIWFDIYEVPSLPMGLSLLQARILFLAHVGPETASIIPHDMIDQIVEGCQRIPSVLVQVATCLRPDIGLEVWRATLENLTQNRFAFQEEITNSYKPLRQRSVPTKRGEIVVQERKLPCADRMDQILEGCQGTPSKVMQVASYLPWMPDFQGRLDVVMNAGRSETGLDVRIEDEHDSLSNTDNDVFSPRDEVVQVTSWADHQAVNSFRWGETMTNEDDHFHLELDKSIEPVPSSIPTSSGKLRPDIVALDLGFNDFNCPFNPRHVLCSYSQALNDKDAMEMKFFHAEGMALLFGVGVPYSNVVLKENGVLEVRQIGQAAWEQFWMESNTRNGRLALFCPVESDDESTDTRESVTLSSTQAAERFGVGVDGMNSTMFIQTSRGDPVSETQVVKPVEWIKSLVQFFKTSLDINQHIKSLEAGDGAQSVLEDSSGSKEAEQGKLQMLKVEIYLDPSNQELRQGKDQIQVLKQNDGCTFEWRRSDPGFRDNGGGCIKRVSSLSEMVPTIIITFLAELDTVTGKLNSKRFTSVLDVGFYIKQQDASHAEEFGWYHDNLRLAFKCTEDNPASVVRRMMKDLSDEVLSKHELTAFDENLQLLTTVTKTKGINVDLRGGCGINGGMGYRGESSTAESRGVTVSRPMFVTMLNEASFSIEKFSGTSTELAYKAALFPPLNSYVIWDPMGEHDTKVKQSGAMKPCLVKIEGEWKVMGDDYVTSPSEVRVCKYQFSCQRDLCMKQKIESKESKRSKAKLPRLFKRSGTKTELYEEVLEQKIVMVFHINHSFSHMQSLLRPTPYEWDTRASVEAPDPIRKIMY